MATKTIICDWCGSEIEGKAPGQVALFGKKLRGSNLEEICRDCYNIVSNLSDRIKQEAADRRMKEVKEVCRQIEKSNS